MKYAIISDVHGNLPALEAVLADAADNGVDGYVFAGDTMSDLPWVNEAAEIIRNLPQSYTVAGNRDSLPEKYGFGAKTLVGIDQMEVLYRTIKGLTPENFGWFSGLPKHCFVPLPFHGQAYAVHWISKLFGNEKKPWNSSKMFREIMEAQPFTHGQLLEQFSRELEGKDIREAVREALADIDASVIVFGHSHVQWYGWCEGRLLINPGSCGLPLDFDARAPYTILEDTENGLSVEERRVTSVHPEKV